MDFNRLATMRQAKRAGDRSTPFEQQRAATKVAG